jgi:hypothetical protein
MSRSLFAVVVLGVAGIALAPPLLQGCSQTGVGDPCVPEAEYSQTFSGFDPGEVNVESKSFQCQTRLCLANHFQGRVSCPYGQTSTGAPIYQPTPSTYYKDKNGNNIIGCAIPGSVPTTASNDTAYASNDAITGDPTTTAAATVQPQCLSRTANEAVYCSCRCANVDGNTNDGANYCSCPQGFSCTQLVSSTGPTDTGLTGAYCIKSGSEYQSASCPSTLVGAPVTVPVCDASKQNCGTYNGQ